MDLTDKPMESIAKWQEWYRKHRVIAEIDTPGDSKDSRENLHDTSNVTSVMPDSNGQISLEDQIKQTPINWQSFTDNTVYKEKAIEHFEDTLAEFSNELNGQEFFDCFKTAVTNYYNTQKQELDRTKELLDLLHGNPCKKTCEKSNLSYGPAWVCYSCGIKHGGWYQEDGTYIGPKAHCATFHHGTCEVCGTSNIAVTEPRDYGQLTRNIDGLVLK